VTTPADRSVWNPLGGGAAWNSVVAGVPFKALELRDLERSYRALYPQDWARPAAIYSFAQSVPADRIEPGATAYVPQMIGNENLRACGPCSGHGRASAPCPRDDAELSLPRGAADYAFDIDQAADAYRRLAGPKRLYVGDFGHPPSTFPGRTCARARSLDAVGTTAS